MSIVEDPVSGSPARGRGFERKPEFFEGALLLSSSLQQAIFACFEVFISGYHQY
ncbi:hypothetical protein [Methanosphaerula subterraneus]|uniref:hypothetical protein n=1 Tax=Methanosphaerula subterraneus TaxID=3350244 RepID=UPI003F8260E0